MVDLFNVDECVSEGGEGAFVDPRVSVVSLQQQCVVVVQTLSVCEPHSVGEFALDCCQSSKNELAWNIEGSPSRINAVT